MVTIARYMDFALANIVCGRLLAEGFNACVSDELSALANDGGIYGTQGVRLQIPDEEAEEAIAILRNIEKQGVPDA